MDFDASEYAHSQANLVYLLRNTQMNLKAFVSELQAGEFGMVVETSDSTAYYFGLTVFSTKKEQTEIYWKMK